LRQRAAIPAVLPAAWRRITVIALYALASWIVIASIGITFASDACVDHTGPCTSTERLIKAALGLLFLTVLTFYIRFGWTGRLPGTRARPSPVYQQKQWSTPARWRGLTVITSWIAWPIVFFNGYWLANIFLKTGRRCSIEGCDPPKNDVLALLFLAAMFGPQIYLTIRWFRWRRSR
jgi:hypothetical protein